MDWPSDQMSANGLLRDRQSLMQQNPQSCYETKKSDAALIRFHSRHKAL
jgi:hypothetical protein